jgi:FtsH-binding integral membrane protein
MNAPEEVYFTKPQMQKIKELRDNDRRFYRKQVIWLLAYTVAIAAPFRIGFDLLVSQPKFHAQFLQPYGIFIIVSLVVLLWVVGLNAAFSRRT